MALYSIHWDRKWRLRRGESRPIGWRLQDSSGADVGRVVDLLADDRTRQVVYAVCEIDGVPPVLVDVDRLVMDEDRREVKAQLSRAALMTLSPATWWRRTDFMRQEMLQAVAEGRSDRIVVPVYGEELTVEKRPVVIEEIVITKVPETRRTTVRERLKQEQVSIEERRRQPVPRDQRAA